ncbi:MAG TPA: hypothetical protein H9867_06980 [Candidatus Corynebacterium gallistercoris]|uniref:DAGKc domain-containing protein n=1 Tax=Candidatus Corynebacterium gallistercoris TaxID=2838530 RepID=A0A9D1UQS0_9CORY|nr:hypothetical protein [Candidatus Corynebacterium gallistercoris]
MVNILVISNLNSTSITERKMRQVIPTLVSIPEAKVTAHFTQYPGHAEELALQARKDGRDAVVVIGGDGTVNEAINGLLGAHRTSQGEVNAAGETSQPLPDAVPLLGVVPTGSANVFARALGFSSTPRKAVAQLAEAISSHNQRRIAVGTWAVNPDSPPAHTRFFAVNAGFGLDADVIEYMENYRSGGKAATPFQYVIASVKMWAQLLRFPPKIAVSARRGPGGAQDIAGGDSSSVEDDTVLRLEDMPVVFASHSNPWTYLGPFPVRTNPGMDFGDGLGIFALRSTIGMGPLLAITGLLLPALRGVSASHYVRFSNAEAVNLQLRLPEGSDDPVRGFQVDGEFVDLSVHGGDPEQPRVFLGVRRDALAVLTPVR